MPIRILPDKIASQISAGEVVERPASVVKELVENALDSGAKHITITIEDAGKRLIEVADDGEGIPADELPLALTHHATSKIVSADDLFRIETLGFRGEALASIGSVSRLTLISCSKGAEIGQQIQVEGGQIGTGHPVGTPDGTVVRVEDLFFSVPARKKFLKTDRTERRHIDRVVTQYALAYPKIRFQLRQESRQVLQTSGNGDSREVLANLYGVETAKQMIEVLAEDEGLRVTGFISPTTLTRSNRREIIFYVNGRPIQDSALVTAVVQAYHTLLMVGRYPLAVLFLQIPSQMVDVNVHPTKAEVRFMKRDLIFRGVGRATRKALLAHTPVPEVNQFGQQIPWTQGWDHATRPWKREIDPGWAFISHDQHSSEVVPLVNTESSDQGELPNVSVPLLRLIGQVAAAFIVAEGPDGMYLIDQHAAHERILFEQLMAQKADRITTQMLLEPVTVELPPASARLVDEQLPLMGKLGFQVEPFGPGTYVVRAIPVLLSGLNPAEALQVLVDDFEEDETPLANEIEARIIARVCKRAAVKAGQVLSPVEQAALLRDLESCLSPRTCPHGRPTMIHLSVDLLERQFGRRGAIT